MRKREINLDIIRTLAIFMVVLNHVVEKIYPYNPYGLNELEEKTKILAMSLFSLARHGVPLFLFLTGYLLLTRSYEGKVIQFWKTRVLPLLLTWEIWIVIYTIFLHFYSNAPISVLYLLKRMLFLERIGIAHEWYMPMIIGMYFLIPIVSIVINKLDTKIICVCLIITFFYYFIVPSMNIVLTVHSADLLFGQLNLLYTGGEFGFYLILGYLSSKIQLKKRVHSILCLAIFTVCYVLIVLFQKYAFDNYVEYALWYTFFLVPISSYCLFLFLKTLDIKGKFISNVSYKISSISFGIYLIHMIPIHLIGDYILALNLHRFIKIILLWCATLVVCYVFSVIIGKSKRLKTVLLYK